MTDNLTYMDCWHYVAPLIPVSGDIGQEVYVKVFYALKQADELEKEKGNELPCVRK